MSHPHSAQLRLLSFLALTPAREFVDLVQIDQARLLRSGDDLFVQSPMARGWAWPDRLALDRADWEDQPSPFGV